MLANHARAFCRPWSSSARVGVGVGAGATGGAGAVGPGVAPSGETPGTAWGADILVVRAGAGRVVFCQLRLLEHFEQQLAKLTFLRLLAL